MEERYLKKLIELEKPRLYTKPDLHQIKKGDNLYLSTANDIFQPNEEVAVNMHHLPSWYQIEQPNKQPMLPHIHDYWELIYVFSGNFYNVINDHKTQLDQNQILLLNPNKIHAPYIQYDSDFIINIIFKKSFVEKHFLDIMAKDNTMFDFFFHYIYGIHDNDDYILFQKTEKNKYLIESIIMEYCDKSHMYQQMITGYLIALFAEFARQSEQNKNPLSQAGNRDISDILLFIKQQFTTVTLNQIAKRFNYSPNYLSRLIKSTTGKTFKEIVLDYKLECVKNLLASTNLSIEKISGILNFKDSFYISKLFKKKYGITPSNYRMNITDKTLF